MLLACPFCREMFDAREHRSCPECEVPLVKASKLGLSHDALQEDGAVESPEIAPLPVFYLRRGRGLLALLAVGGLVAFFLPWVKLTMPDIVDYSGFVVSHRLGWTWGAGVAWFVLLPTALTRRSIVQMRGARVAAAFLAAVPGVTAAVLFARPPHGSQFVPLRFTFGPGLFATAALSLLAMAVAFRFGGRADHPIRVAQESSRGQLVH